MGSHLRQGNNKRFRKILAWLRQNPVPRLVRAVHEDGSEVEVVVQPPQGRIRWTDAARALYKCTELTALDDANRQLRIMDLEPSAEDEAELNRIEIAHQKLLAEHDARLPGREPIISVDVPALVTSIASAMKDVAKAAAEQNADAHRSGYEAMTNVMTVALQLLQRVEQRLADKEEDLEEERETRTEELAQLQQAASGGNRDALVQLALQRVVGGEVTRGGESNGNPAGDKIDPTTAAKLGELLVQWAQQQGNTPDGGGS